MLSRSISKQNSTRHLLTFSRPLQRFSSTFPRNTMAGKRKASLIESGTAEEAKRIQLPKNEKINPQERKADVEESGLVNRKYYPPEITQERCLLYNQNKIKRPIEELKDALKETISQRGAIPVNKSVVHWFKQDLRTRDNTALHKASEQAKKANVPLIGLYIVSPQDFEAHLTSRVRVDFILRSLRVLQQDLAKLDIPLYVETVERRKKIPARVLELCKQWGASHLYTNMEYEVDELRREALLARLGLAAGVALNVFHDTCVVEPGQLKTGAGNQYAVYSPWFRSYVSFLHSHPNHLRVHPPPAQNPSSARTNLKELFDMAIPDAPANKALNEEEKHRYRAFWPVGEEEARERLAKFLDKRVSKYKDSRNMPAEDGTSMLSVHFASGSLSARTAIAAAQEINTSPKLDAGNLGIMTWISEVAWRDFYKHVLVQWPFVCMNKCFKPEYTNIRWEYNDEQFEAWKAGRTGYPLVDAGMRQAQATGYMHNRVRMVVASFLAKDLLLDWRLGEQYFMELLIDGDFASNNGGWGFSSSAGVDPQPYFRVFNPTLQSEKFDPDGTYIRKWLPELKEIKGKAIHDPYSRGSEYSAKKNGYPKPIVEHKFARNRALSRYKEGLGRDTA